MIMAENDGNDPNRLLYETLTTRYRTTLREQSETLHEEEKVLRVEKID